MLIAFLTDMSNISHLLYFIRYEHNFPEHNFKKICIQIREENFRPIITLICCQNFLNMKIAWNNLRLIKVRYIWIIFRKLINITQGCWETCILVSLPVKRLYEKNKISFKGLQLTNSISSYQETSVAAFKSYQYGNNIPNGEYKFLVSYCYYCVI